MRRDWRNTVSWFSGIMEYKLKMNDHKGDWRDMQLDELMQGLAHEYEELQFEVITKPSCDKTADVKSLMTRIILEAGDLANYAMFVADKAQQVIEVIEGEDRR